MKPKVDKPRKKERSQGKKRGELSSKSPFSEFKPKHFEKKRKKDGEEESPDQNGEFNLKMWKGLTLKPGSRWTDGRNFSVEEEAEWMSLPMKDILELKKEAEQLLEEDSTKYRSLTHSNKDIEWARTLIKSGTMLDRMAAYVLVIQESTVHNLIYIRQLVRLVATKSKREGESALKSFL